MRSQTEGLLNGFRALSRVTLTRLRDYENGAIEFQSADCRCRWKFYSIKMPGGSLWRPSIFGYILIVGSLHVREFCLPGHENVALDAVWICSSNSVRRSDYVLEASGDTADLLRVERSIQWFKLLLNASRLSRRIAYSAMSACRIEE
jgi:hypothetical protein